MCFLILGGKVLWPWLLLDLAETMATLRIEHRFCSSKDKAGVMTLRDRLQVYCGRDSDLAQNIRMQDAMGTLWARLLAFYMEHRARHEVCGADVLPDEDAKNSRSDVAEIEQYGIAQNEDQLDEVNIRGLNETPRPTFISQYLAPE
ncbi:hypothetical protein Droror1_Dr00027793, partial [Drosera rotundifolia]